MQEQGKQLGEAKEQWKLNLDAAEKLREELKLARVTISSKDKIHADRLGGMQKSANEWKKNFEAEHAAALVSLTNEWKTDFEAEHAAALASLREQLKASGKLLEQARTASQTASGDRASLLSAIKAAKAETATVKAHATEARNEAQGKVAELSAKTANLCSEHAATLTALRGQLEASGRELEQAVHEKQILVGAHEAAKADLVTVRNTTGAIMQSAMKEQVNHMQGQDKLLETARAQWRLNAAAAETLREELSGLRSKVLSQDILLAQQAKQLEQAGRDRDRDLKRADAAKAELETVRDTTDTVVAAAISHLALASGAAMRLANASHERDRVSLSQEIMTLKAELSMHAQPLTGAAAALAGLDEPRVQAELLQIGRVRSDETHNQDEREGVEEWSIVVVASESWDMASESWV